MIFAAIQTHSRHGLSGKGMAFRPGHAAIDQRQFNVFDSRGAGQQIEALKHKAQIIPPEKCPGIVVQRRDINALKMEVAGCRAVEAAQDIHGGGFAGA